MISGSLSQVIRDWLLGEILQRQSRLETTLENVMTTVNELPAALASVKDTLEKAKVEILQKIADLEAALGNTPIPPEAEALLASLLESATALDNIVPDL